MDGAAEGSRFVLVLDDGEEVQVDPEGALISGIQGTPTSPYEIGQLRDLLVRLSAGDEVWVTGVLSRPKQQGVGAYRSGVSARTVRAPRGGRIEISSTSPLPGWTALGRAHKVGANLAVAALVAVHALFFRQVDGALLTDGVAALSDVIELHQPLFWLLVVAGLVAIGIPALAWSMGVKRARRAP